MAKSTIRVAQLATSDIAAGAELFADAFDRDAIARLITPGAAERRASWLRGGRTLLERAMPYRHVFGAYEGDELCGIVVWLPPGVTVRSGVTPSPRAMLRIAKLLVTKGPRLIRYVRARGRALSQAHKYGAWHLAFLATHPAHQRRGVARLLLDHVLLRAEADGTPVWLETSEPVNVTIYEKFGFATLASVEGDDLPTFWIMLRSGTESEPEG